ncbi:MAG: hypothetical protein ACI9R3_002186 [Verrucomicrobiales bacterium]|jgi:hypothetical protein
MPDFLKTSRSLIGTFLSQRRILPAIALVFLQLPCANLRADTFTEKVEPILEEHCYDCHGEDKQKSELRLDTPAGITLGGNSGEPLLIAHESAASYIIRRVASDDRKQRMPPKGPGLTQEEATVLRRWIDEGARFPAGAGVAAEITTAHWSFLPVVRPPAPIKNDPFLANEIDSFVLAKLRESKLEPAPTANRPTLIRRLYLAIHGMPPTPEEVEFFVNDTSSGAWENLVARVLQSPRFGERWGRHWLDVARYADTNGFETNRERKNAYHYRDWVIQAFNDDKPYDAFIKEQLAGDALDADAATGFLVAGPYDIVKSPDTNLTAMQRQDELADMINTTGTAFLGLTIGCARCHNHKFDPVLQKDYYSMQAVFAGVQYADRSLRTPADPAVTDRLAELAKQLKVNRSALDGLKLKAARQSDEASNPARPAVDPRENVETFAPTDARFVRFTILACSGAEPCIDELEVYDAEGTNIALAKQGTKPTASGTLNGYEAHKLEHINDGRTGNARSWISNTGGTCWVQIEFATAMAIEKIVWGRDREGQFADRVATDYQIEASLDGKDWKTIASSAGRAPFRGASNLNAFLAALSDMDATQARVLIDEAAHLKEQINNLKNGPTAWAGTFAQPGPTHRLYRGDHTQQREQVAPDALAVLGSLGMAMDEPEQNRRLQLAKWIANKDNPLTARVMVNRIWHYIFGTGIVETPSDLGGNGIAPTHPELLDWLADEFMRSGWSVKHVQKLILLSSTFQQSSAPRVDAAAIDSSSRMLWRFPPRRLEAEAIRDSILAVSGALELTGGGPGFYLQEVEIENVMHYFPKEKFGPPEFRRMVYLFKIRQEQDSVFGSFDCPDGNQVTPKRSRSNTPLQALNLYNSPFILQQATILAQRLSSEPSDAARVTRAFKLAFSREPDDFEQQVSQEMIKAEGLEAFCRAMFNTSEFLFVF